MKIFFHLYLSVLALLGMLLSSCSSHGPEPSMNILFEVKDHEQTGLNFTNKLTYTGEFNLFTYMYFYNGSGVGAGDFNQDGLIDLYFGSNQQQNRLYLNKGNLRFSDVTEQALPPGDGGWSTGISVVDINNDGLLDIYVCRVGHFETLQSKNLLLINQGISQDGTPSFKEMARDYGLDFSGFSTQAAFFDYDQDGDLDMYLLNHAVHESGSYRPRKDFEETYSDLSGDRIFRNEGNHFTDVTRQAGINSSSIGYGLGISIADINQDGYPDVYVGNDFHENDYLYINQKNGTFREEGTSRLMHTSQFSMGVDVADANNDGLADIISVDMMPADPYILKRSLGEDAYDIFNFKIGFGYSHQYARNNLQFNQGNGMFSEIGLYSGVYATDWSWAPLWCDFDNDGLKDLFISNGIPKRLNDIDYINFVSNEELQSKLRLHKVGEKDLALIKKFPEIKLPNKFFLNEGNMSFADMGSRIGNDHSTFSNGAVYADLDNDGDLDVVVNNIDDPVLVYENKSSRVGSASSLQVKLNGPAGNTHAIGARILVYAGTQTRIYEKFPVRGFLSSMEIPVHIGLKNTAVDSIVLIWPDNRYQMLNIPDSSGFLNVTYQSGLPAFDFTRMATEKNHGSIRARNIASQAGITFLHRENAFTEFDREPLLPHMLSTEGPALAIADIDHNGLDDVYLGGARNQAGAIFLQEASGRFRKCRQPALEADSSREDVDACWTDINNDGHPDLVVASGGNEFYGDDSHNAPRLYLNDGRGNLNKLPDAFPGVFLTASGVAAADVNNDGFTDLFFAARAMPAAYGKIPRSYLLLNDGKGGFTDVTSSWSPELEYAGLVTAAIWIDMDKDGDQDLVLALEWDGIKAFRNEKGRLVPGMISEKKGWWTSILPIDIDLDGDIDFIAGNQGLNNRLKASGSEPVRMYYSDFDDNYKGEQIITYYLCGKEITLANKADLEKQIPQLKKKYLYAGEFAKASLGELFDVDKIKTARTYTADYFSNAILINQGNNRFETRALPWLAQLTTIRSAVPVDANHDSLPDLLLAGNFYDNNIAMGRSDVTNATLLINKGKGDFICQNLKGLPPIGQVRKIKPLSMGGHEVLVFARNNDSAMVIGLDSIHP